MSFVLCFEAAQRYKLFSKYPNKFWGYEGYGGGKVSNKKCYVQSVFCYYILELGNLY